MCLSLKKKNHDLIECKLILNSYVAKDELEILILLLDPILPPMMD